MDFSLIKRHPYATGAIVIVGGFAAYLLFSGGSGSQTVTTGSGVDPALAASEVQAATQLQLQQGASSAQQQAQSFQLASDAATAGANFALAQLNAKTSTTQQVNAIVGQENLQSDQNSTQLIMQKNALTAASNDAKTMEATQVALATAQTTANVAIAQTTAAQNLGIASITGQVQRDIANYQSQTQIATVNAQSQALQSEAQSFAAGRAVAGGGIGDIFGGIASIAGMFL